MAGIGFELKKMFDKKGLLSMLKAYGYAGIVVTGPMILGVVLLLGIRIISQSFCATELQMELLNSMVTVTLLGSLVISNAFSLCSTRYVADQLYENNNGHILPSFFGNVNIMLVIGCVGYGIFLILSGISLNYIFLCLLLYTELLLVWTEINYLTAIKDYRSIILIFAFSLLIGFATGFILGNILSDIVFAMLIAICVAYGLMSVAYYYLLVKYFPQGDCSCMHFIRWFEKYKELFFLGICISLGMFGHLCIMWYSPARVQVYGLFYGTPIYDIPALLAFFSILITTINFVTSIEVNFYPKYRNYYALFNDDGSFMDIELALKEMTETLFRELTNTFTKQFFATVIFIIGGTMLFPLLPLGITDEMLGIYRILCIGYALYAIGNCAMLLQLYFADNRGALISGIIFCVVSCTMTIVFINGDSKYYGVGFTLGALLYAIVSLILLIRYLKSAIYHTLCSQPMIVKEDNGFLTKISEYFCERYNKKNC